jgi:hypothetical protein
MAKVLRRRATRIVEWIKGSATSLMPTPAFALGFRFSNLDGVVLVVGVIGTAVFWAFAWWIGFVIGFTIAHFFLFCNVFRLARPLELAWAGAFVALCSATIILENPGWLLTIAISLCVTILVVAIEMRKPSYHGFGWRVINPRLQTWWESQWREASPVNSADARDCGGM